MADDFNKDLRQAIANVSVGGELVNIKHNESDYTNFRQFKKHIDDRYPEIEAKRERRERASNLANWITTLPPRWKSARLSKIETPTAEKVLDIILTQGASSFYLSGASESGKTYISYAIITKYIARGYLTPSQVKIVSEESILSLATSGFAAKERIEELFSPKYKLYLLDNVGMRDEYSAKEAVLLERLIDHIYNNSLLLLATSVIELDVFSRVLNESIVAKLANIFGSNAIHSNNSRNRKNMKDDDPFSG